jgi:hypothetical protein
MRNHVLLASFAALCATVSTAGATSFAPAPAAVEVVKPVALVKPVTFGYRRHFGLFRPYYAPYYVYPYDYGYAHYSYYSSPRWHRHWH